MSYISETCGTLTRTVERFVTLNAYQLAGHVANLDFWLSEIEHATAVIDGYPRRFERMKKAQVSHVRQRGTVLFSLEFYDPIGETPPPPRGGVSDSERKELRRSLLDAAYRFVVRCGNEGMIDRNTVWACLQRLGLDLEESDLNGGQSPDPIHEACGSGRCC